MRGIKLYKKLIRFVDKLTSMNYETGVWYCNIKIIRYYAGRFYDYRIGKDYAKLIISPQELIINLYHASTEWGKDTYAGKNGLWNIPNSLENAEQLIKFRNNLLDTADMIRKYELENKDIELPNNKQGVYKLLSDVVG